MAAPNRENELAALMVNRRYQMLAKRSQHLRYNEPPQEHSYYPYKCGISELLFPPQKGFMIKPQCRVGNFAHPNAGPTRYRSDSMETKTGDDGKYPDDVVVWLPYKPHLGVDQNLPHIPVLVEEVKPVMPLNTKTYRRARNQLCGYVKSLSSHRIGNNALDPQPARQRVPGLLVLGTRCIRYEAIGEDGRLRVVAVDDDANEDAAERHYGVLSLADPNDKILLNWLLDLRDHFVQFNAAGELFPGLLNVEIAKFVRQDPAYEASLHGVLYMILNAVARSLLEPGEDDDWFLVKPQAPLRLKYDGPDLPADVKTHLRNTSYGREITADSLGLVDFILVWLTPPITWQDQIRDTPVLALEAKRDNSEKNQEEVFEQLSLRMQVFKLYGFIVSGLAVLGGRWWMVGWENDVPKRPNWALESLLSAWETIKDVFDLSHP